MHPGVCGSPQSPLYGSVLPADSVRPLDQSVSATRCFHERICQACRRKVRVPGLERPANGPVMRCPHCDAKIGISETRGIRTTPIIQALVIGITAGCGILWLGHAGLTAPQSLGASRLLVTVPAGFGTSGSA